MYEHLQRTLFLLNKTLLLPLEIYDGMLERFWTYRINGRGRLEAGLVAQREKNNIKICLSQKNELRFMPKKKKLLVLN